MNYNESKNEIWSTLKQHYWTEGDVYNNYNGYYKKDEFETTLLKPLDELDKVFNIETKLIKAMSDDEDVLVINIHSKDISSESIIEIRCYDFGYSKFKTRYTYNENANKITGFCEEGLPLLEIMKIMANEYLRVTKTRTANIVSDKTNLFNK